MRALSAVLAAALWGVPVPAGAQPRPASGKVLVAKRGLPDPNFAETVVLLLYHDGENVMGVVLNRPTDIPLSSVFEDMPEAKDRKDPIYLGGPVGRTGVIGLLKADSKPEGAEQVIPGLYTVRDKKLLQKVFADKTAPGRFRVYAGYAGWSGPQLERELREGAWFLFPADASMVFDPDPRTLWSRLIARSELKVAEYRNFKSCFGVHCSIWNSVPLPAAAF